MIESTDTHLSPTDSTEAAKVQSPNGNNSKAENNTLKETSSEKQIPLEATEEKQHLIAQSDEKSEQSDEKSEQSEKQNGIEVKEETPIQEGITNAT
jgi:hypothetical protein